MEHSLIAPTDASPSALAALLLSYPREHLEALTEALVATLDVQDAPNVEDEPDFMPHGDGLPGDPGDHEPGGDEEAGAWVEWTTMRGSQKGGHNLLSGHEDDEEDDAAEEDDPSGLCDEDGVNTGGPSIFELQGAGCPIADDDHEHDGREHGDGY